MCKKQKGLHNRIDPCIKTFIKLLNFYIEPMKVKTVASCCGHGKYPTTILIKGKPYTPAGFKNPFKKSEKEIIQDLVSGKIIPRTRNFYKKDKQGYYFIPEVSNAK